MAKDAPQSKAAKAAAASNQGKAKKKKWSKGKVKDKSNNAVMLEKVVFDKISKEAPTSKLITPSVLVERFKINASLARRVLKELHAAGKIKLVVAHASQLIYTRSVVEEDK